MKKILVATDFSPCSDKALDYAAHLAQETGAELIVFSGFFLAPTPSVNTPSTLYIQDTLDQKKQLIEEDLHRAVAKYRTWVYNEDAQKTLDILVIARNGLPEVSISEISNEKHTDLIVMGAKGKTALAKILFGSVTRRILDEEIPCPVLAVPQETNYESPKQIVFSSKFQLSDAPAIDWLLKFAKNFHSQLTLLNVSQFDDEPIGDESAIKKQYFYTAESEMNYQQIRSESPVKGLHEYLDKSKAQIAAMYKKDKGFIDWLADGSFTEKMLFSTHVPILIYK